MGRSLHFSVARAGVLSCSCEEWELLLRVVPRPPFSPFGRSKVGSLGQETAGSRGTEETEEEGGAQVRKKGSRMEMRGCCSQDNLGAPTEWGGRLTGDRVGIVGDGHGPPLC